jgi:hypothetical protein
MHLPDTQKVPPCPNDVFNKTMNSCIQALNKVGKANAVVKTSPKAECGLGFLIFNAFAKSSVVQAELRPVEGSSRDFWRLAGRCLFGSEPQPLILMFGLSGTHKQKMFMTSQNALQGIRMSPWDQRSTIPASSGPRKVAAANHKMTFAFNDLSKSFTKKLTSEQWRKREPANFPRTDFLR